ncbi:MAG TPA: FtsX-like permease family protein [Verrucomicrobiae bacterium]|nr:FtsX-like permease family protein [Verrucomicrobiae bacterium]
MFLRVLGDALARQKRRKAIVLVAVVLGTAAASAPADIALDVGDRMSRELKSFGANLVVVPRGGSAPVRVGGADFSSLHVPAYLAAADVLKVKDNFWKNNILGFAPILDVPAEVSVATAGRNGGRNEEVGPPSGPYRSVLLRGAWLDRPFRLDGTHAPVSTSTAPDAMTRTGLRRLNPYWEVDGAWPVEPAALPPPTETNCVLGAAPRLEADGQGALVGRGLAASLGVKPGDLLRVRTATGETAFAVSGVLATGGEEEEMLLAPLEAVQETTALRGKLSRVLVSALTTPESAVYERKALDPRALSPKEFESWSCTPFVSSIAYEIEESWPGAEARVVRRVADAEGAVLRRASGLMILVAIMGVFGAALTVASALTAGILERRVEIGLLKSLGARDATVIGLFLAEAATLALVGGLAGSAAGAWLARILSASVFGSPVAIRPVSIPLAVACALGITLVGSILPVRRIAGFRPAEVLRGA